MKKRWMIVLLCTLMLVLAACGGEADNTPPETDKTPIGTTSAPAETTNPEVQRWEKNVLCSDEVMDVDGDGYVSIYDGRACSVFGSHYQRDQIRSVTFLNTLEDMPEEAWDVSADWNSTVMAWVKPNGALYDLYIAGEGGVCADSSGRSCSGMFMGYENVLSIDFNDAFHTNEAVNMSYMFYGCKTLEFLDLSCFDTSNVRNMNLMFGQCYNLESLDLSSFDTSNVQGMSGMFYDCKALKGLNLSNFDTSNVFDMGSMFMYCKALESLDLSSFDTSNVMYMGKMFGECEALRSLKLSEFDTSNADTEDMFYNCPAGADYQHLLN